MPPKQEQRHVYYDRDLELEAYNLSGVVQKFPNHFHEYYVVGFVEGGRRHLWCKGREYDLRPGDMLLFNPRDNHCCAPVNGEILDYRALNIGPSQMGRWALELTGRAYTPHFTQNVAAGCEMSQLIGDVYDAILRGAPRLEKEEALLFLLGQLFQEYAAPFEEREAAGPDAEIKALCAYMEAHFAENITLDELAAMTRYGKSYLLRAFTRQVGVSPYRYLQTVRLGRAKKFLEEGAPPIEAASLAGFSDQSHFTNFFKGFTGLTPKMYQRIFTAGAAKNQDGGREDA